MDGNHTVSERGRRDRGSTLPAGERGPQKKNIVRGREKFSHDDAGMGRWLATDGLQVLTANNGFEVSGELGKVECDGRDALMQGLHLGAISPRCHAIPSRRAHRGCDVEGLATSLSFPGRLGSVV